MPYNPPLNNEPYVTKIALQDMANPGSFKVSPTIAAGDFKKSQDGGALSNLSTLPTHSPEGSIWVNISLSAEEMAFDNIAIQCIDQSNPKEWADYAFVIQTASSNVNQTGDTYAIVNNEIYGNAAIKTLVDTLDDFVDTEIAAIKSKTDNLPANPADVSNIPTLIQITDSISELRIHTYGGVLKNTALNNFEFKLVSSTNHLDGVTGATVTAERSIDGGAFASCSNGVFEISDGFYKINLSAGDLNGNVITLMFSAVGADNREITLLTNP